MDHGVDEHHVTQLLLLRQIKRMDLARRIYFYASSLSLAGCLGAESALQRGSLSGLSGKV